MRLRLSILLIAIIGFFFTPNILKNSHVLANNNISTQSDSFSTSLETTYIVSLDGSTHAKYNFIITNLKPTIFVKQYAIRLQQTGLTNITATNQGSAIKPNVSVADNQTNIALSFPDEIVGQGKERIFQIEFDTPQLATITGKVLEVRIPEVADTSTYQKRKVTLITPREFGDAYRISPEPSKTTTSGKQITSIFTNLNQRGVVAIYGKEQVFRLNLRYFLDNPTGSPITTQIALPPTTSFQEMNYQTLEPKPDRMKEDADGNWLAEYSLRPHQEIIVNSVVLTRITLDANPKVPIIQPSSNHLTGQPYWPVDDRQISDFSNQTTNIGEIYQLVVNTLTYTDQELTGPRDRLGALGTLEQPDQVVCQEFTDLFVTLARNKGIPARRAAGYAVAEDRALRPLSLVGDVLHSWADYFDAPSGRWRSVDPTWESTTGGIDYFSQFDLNHIVFVMNGESSTLPYPAGFYKQGNTPTQDVVVEMEPNFTQAEPQFKVDVQPNKFLGLTIPGWHTLSVTNQSGQAWYQVDGQVSSGNSKKITAGTKPLSVDISPDAIRWRSLLPYETKQVPIFLSRPGFDLTHTDLHLSLQLGNHEQEFSFQINQKLSIIPSILSGPSQLYIALSVAGAVIILTLTTGSLLVLRHKRQSLVRRQSQTPQQKSPILPAAKKTAGTTPQDGNSSTES